MNTIDSPTITPIDSNLGLIANSFDNEKFNFAKTKVENKKQFFLFLIAIIIIFTSSIGYSVYSNGIVEVPEIIIPTSSISNDPLIIVSKSKPFYVKYNNDIIHSKIVDRHWSVDLGKPNGITDVQVGGMIDFGFTKIVSTTSKTYTFDRDYDAPVARTNFDRSNVIGDRQFIITLDKQESDFIVRENQAIIFDKYSNSNRCKMDSNNPLKLNCSKLPANNNMETQQLIITDQSGNSSSITNE